MKKSSFEYGPVAKGIFMAMLWLVVLIAFTLPLLLIVYIPLLLFLGLGLRPFLIKTGLHQTYQSISAKLDDQKNERLKKAYHKQNRNKLAQQDNHIKSMRKKMMSREKITHR